MKLYKLNNGTIINLEHCITIEKLNRYRTPDSKYEGNLIVFVTVSQIGGFIDGEGDFYPDYQIDTYETKEERDKAYDELIAHLSEFFI